MKDFFKFLNRARTFVGIVTMLMGLGLLWSWGVTGDPVSSTDIAVAAAMVIGGYIVGAPWQIKEDVS